LTLYNGTSLASEPQSVGGNPQLDGGLPQTPRKQGDKSGEERGQQPIVNIKKFSDMPYRNKSDVIAGAILLIGIFALVANLLVGRDKKYKPDNEGRADD
jgi:hypothetical protein